MLQRIIARGKRAAQDLKQKSGHARNERFDPVAEVPRLGLNPDAKSRCKCVSGAPVGTGKREAFMRCATAALCRQAFFAALASAVLAGALSAASGTARPQGGADMAFNPPILVRSVALDHALIVSEARAPVDVPTHELARAAAPAKAQILLARRVCAAPPCQRVVALALAAPRRAAAQGEPAPTKVAFEAPVPEEDKRARSFSERLLQPVGNLRDRVIGLISSL
jgi:hypothetical protein